MRAREPIRLPLTMLLMLLLKLLPLGRRAKKSRPPTPSCILVELAWRGYIHVGVAHLYDRVAQRLPDATQSGLRCYAVFSCAQVSFCFRMFLIFCAMATRVCRGPALLALAAVLAGDEVGG